MVIPAKAGIRALFEVQVGFDDVPGPPSRSIMHLLCRDGTRIIE